jgi:O-antigen ligase
MRVLLVLFALTIALSPLPLGANRDWAWSPLGAVIGTLLVALAAGTLILSWPVRTSARFEALLVPGLCFGLVVAWGFLQLSGWTPGGWATSVSASDVLGVPARRSVAFDTEQQLTALMRLLTYGGVFVLAAVLGQQATQARGILAAIVIVATLTTVYAMVADSINSQARTTGFAVWVPLEKFFSGTFVNSNNYGTYAGVSALAALALAFPPPGRAEGRETRGERWRRRLAKVSGMSGVWIALALILGTGVLLSGSRAAALSLVVGLVIMTAFYSRGLTRVALLVAIPLAILTLIVLTPTGERLVSKTIVRMTEGQLGREALLPMALDAISLRPFTGWGMNSFGELYGLLQPPTVDVYYDKVHNTYLDLAFGLGIPAACAIVFAVGWIVWRCMVAFANRRRDRELAGLGVFITVLAGFHALFDFSFEIPAFACTYFTMLGVAWAQSWSSRQQ